MNKNSANDRPLRSNENAAEGAHWLQSLQPTFLLTQSYMLA